MKNMNILFVCNGNKCRSPLAAGILRQKLVHKKMSAIVDSAGFEAFYINELPDKRAIEKGLEHGIDISDNHVRLFSSNDYDDFDKIYVMDLVAYRNAIFFARNDSDKIKLEYLMNVIKPDRNESVPDPFYRELDACDSTFKILNDACEEIANKVIPQN